MSTPSNTSSLKDCRTPYTAVCIHTGCITRPWRFIISHDVLFLFRPFNEWYPTVRKVIAATDKKGVRTGIDITTDHPQAMWWSHRAQFGAPNNRRNKTRPTACMSWQGDNRSRPCKSLDVSMHNRVLYTERPVIFYLSLYLWSAQSMESYQIWRPGQVHKPSLL